MKLEKWYVIQEAINSIFKGGEYHESWNEFITDDLFEFLCDKLGEEQIAEKITKHPTRGYMVRYADDWIEGRINEIHKENIKKNEVEIKKLRTKTN